MKMIKTLKQFGEDTYIDFTPEELEELGLKIGDRFECFVDDFSLVLKKIEMSTIDIDLDESSKENLSTLIQYMHEKNQTVNETVEEVLTDFVNKHENNI